MPPRFGPLALSVSRCERERQPETIAAQIARLATKEDATVTPSAPPPSAPQLPRELDTLVSGLPAPADKPVSLRVTNSAASHLRKGHPWLFQSAITHQNHPGQAGDVAVIYDGKRNFVAVGLLDPDSPIAVRVLAPRKRVEVDAAFLQQRIQQASTKRDPLLATQTDGYRVIHGENDGLGALVVDRYADTVVLKLYSLAWLPHLRPILVGLLQTLAPERLVLRLSRNIQEQAQEEFGLSDGMLLLGQGRHPALFLENGLRFEADPFVGQKTGFFLDQRENRARVAELCNGARVLNVFSYSGAFSVYAAAGGARSVLGVDQSGPANAGAAKNFAHNSSHPQVARCDHQTRTGDAFAVLNALRMSRERFDVVIIDPPSFAKRKEEVEGALRSYQRLTELGLDVLTDGGDIVLCSCSSQVTAEGFVDAVTSAARLHGRKLGVREQSAHGLDHPITFDEAGYLKAVFARA